MLINWDSYRVIDREIEEERREKERLALEKVRADSQHATSHHLAFVQGRAGDSAAMKVTIGRFDLDVTAPEHPRVKVKEGAQYESMLHVAAAYCEDSSLLDFILRRGKTLPFFNPVVFLTIRIIGAQTNLLDRSNLAPFHRAILHGNMAAAKWFLDRYHIRPLEGCHPSKAAADGRTPLQLAIASGSSEMVQCVLKDATVHDVIRSWEQGEIHIFPTKRGDPSQFKEENWDAIKKILLTKVRRFVTL